MPIYSVSEFEKPFVSLTVPPALKQLGQWLNTQVIVRDYRLWNVRAIDRDSSNDVLVIVECSYLDYCRLSVKELRTYFPNGKIVVLGSDTKYYQARNTFQINHPSEVDLWLDLMTECAGKYKNVYGIKADTWAWTIAKSQYDYLENFKETFLRQNGQVEKKYDAISVLSPHTLERGYRKEMVDYLNKSNLRFTNGGGHGQMDTNVIKIYENYLRSSVVIGSSSHDNQVEVVRSIKGWRDSLAHPLDILLIYDDHPDIIKFYGGCVPLYKYDDFSSLVHLINSFKNDPERYARYVRLQKDFILQNTIEQQLFRLLNKHGIINERRCCL